jgi:hypothetical protein
MVQIDLTPKQVEELKNHYILELEKLQQRSAEVMGLLSKLVHGPIATLPAKQAELAQPAGKTEEKTKRRGRPTTTPNLGDFIIQLLTEKNKPLTSEQIIKGYKKQFKIDLSGSTATMSSLNQTLFRLRAKQNLITSTRRKGKKGNVYSLVKKDVTPIVKTKPAKEKKTAAPIIKTKPAKEKKTAAPIIKTKPAKEKKTAARIVKTKPVKEKKAAAAKELVPAASKNNWPQFIVDTLNKHKRVLSLKDFLGNAMVQFSIPAKDKKSTYGKISPVLTQMVKAKDKIRAYRKAGTSLKFYALNDWFTDKNELITTYK